MNIQDIKSNTTWQEASNTINNNNNKISLAISTLENVRLKNKGYFTSVEKLNQAIPKPSVGSKAYVGTSEPYAIYIVENGAWVDSGYTGGDEIVAKITTDRIEDGAVTSEKISTSAFDSTLSVSGKIAPADVVGEKLNELENIVGIGTNYIEGHLITANGSIVENAMYSYSDKIPVNADILSKGLIWNYGTYISNARLVLLSGNSVVDAFGMIPDNHTRKFTSSQLSTAIASNATDVIISFETANGGSLYTTIDNVELYKSGDKEGWLIKDVVSIKEQIEIIDTEVNKKVDTDKIEDGAVTIDKVNFIHTNIGKNLIDVNTMLHFGRLDETSIIQAGDVGESYNYRYTDELVLKPNTDYVLSVKNGFVSSSSVYWWLIDDNGEFIATKMTDSEKIVFSTTSAYKIRFTILKDAIVSNLMLEEGTTRTEPYEPYLVTNHLDESIKVSVDNTNNIGTDDIKDKAVTIDKVEFTTSSKNLINVNDVDFTLGAYLPLLNTNPSYNSTGYIKVEYGKTYCFSNKGNSSLCRFVYGYAEKGGTYIKRIGENVSAFTIDDETINYVRISYPSSFKYPMLEEGETPTEYVEYGLFIDEKYLPKTEDYSWLFKVPELVFPSVIYALKGHENSIYHKNYMNFVNPYIWAIQSTKRDSHWKYRERCFRINPSDTAVSRLRVYLYNKITLEQKFFKDIPTNLVEIMSAPALTRVNVIGDSFTYNGMWYRQIQDKLNNIKLVGMRKSYQCDDDMRGEGRGGWTLNDYATASYEDLAINHMQPFSPFLQVEGYTYYGPIQFWDAVVNGTSKYPNLYTYGTLGFQDYINWFDANGYKKEPNVNDLMYDGNLGKYVCWNGSEWAETNVQKTDFTWDYAKYVSTWNIAEPDIVMILLGTNDFLGGYSNFDNWKSQMDGLIASIKTYKPTMKIGICTAFVTTEAANSSDAVNGFISTRNEWEARKLVIENYDTEENKGNGVYVVDTGVVIDPDYGFAMKEQKPFADYEGNAVEYYGSNGVHCGDGGYKQLGTCAAAFVEYVRSLE